LKDSLEAVFARSVELVELRAPSSAIRFARALLDNLSYSGFPPLVGRLREQYPLVDAAIRMAAMTAPCPARGHSQRPESPVNRILRVRTYLRLLQHLAWD
jgi:hypothetical protein